jgi:acetyl-CoA acetyltransferase
MVVEPYHLLDISLVPTAALLHPHHRRPRQGSPEAAGLCARARVRRSVGRTVVDKKNFTHMAVHPAKEQAFGQAALTLEDVDCAQFYDCFTAEVLFQLEDYGFCKKGEGGSFVEAGMGRAAASWSTPAGLLSCYHLGDLTGMADPSAFPRRGG